MEKLPTIEDLGDIKGKRALVRGDLDVPLREDSSSLSLSREWVVADDNRLKLIVPTIRQLLESEAAVILCGHLGRPGKREGGRWTTTEEEREKFSLAPVGQRLLEILGQKTGYEFVRLEQSDKLNGARGGELKLLENLRFDAGEQLDSSTEEKEALAERLAKVAEFYVNESFAESHREVASIVATPQKFRFKSAGGPGKNGALGLRFLEEVQVLSSVLTAPTRPLVCVIGGAKIETKLPAITKMEGSADKVLVGGKLCSEIAGKGLKFSQKVVVASLSGDGKDIDEESARRFSQEIKQAGMVVWNGPMGVFEMEGSEQGTKVVAMAIGGSAAIKIAGGGDTEAAIKKYGLVERFDWISSGGGAMLEYLATGTLPGIKAVIV